MKITAIVILSQISLLSAIILAYIPKTIILGTATASVTLIWSENVHNNITITKKSASVLISLLSIALKFYTKNAHYQQSLTLPTAPVHLVMTPFLDA